MEQLDRRRVLTGAVLGSAAVVGATAFGPTSPEAAHAHEQETAYFDDAPDPNFFEGRITAIDGTMVTIIDSENVVGLIQVTNATSIWKLHPTSLRAAEIGDGLYARGVRLDSGVLAAESIWLNIVNLHVEIVDIRAGSLLLDHNGGRMVGHIVDGVTAVANAHGGATADLSGLGVGSHIQLIGAWRPDTNEIDIATIHAEY